MSVAANPTIDLYSQQPQAIFYLEDGVALFQVTGNPEGVVAANAGSIAVDGSGNLYTKTTDLLNTGWVLNSASAAAIGGSLTGGTAGSVLFVGTGPVLSQDNSNLFWDNTNKRFGIGTNAPANALDVRQNTPNALIRMQNTNATGYVAFDFVDSGGTGRGGVGYSNASSGAPFQGKMYMSAGGDLYLVTNGNNRFAFQTNGDLIGVSGRRFGWVASSSDPSGTQDAGITRAAAGEVQIEGASGVIGVLRTGRRVAAATTTTSPATTESRTTYTNEGATALVQFNLPTAAAGYSYSFIVQDADGIRVVAAAGDTIRLAGSVSAAAGRIDSTTIGSTVTLVSINATEWVALSFSGTWSVT